MSITVSAPYLRLLLAGAAARGVATDDLLADPALRAALDDDGSRLDQQHAHALWEEVARRAGNPAFGLHLAAGLQRGDFAVLDYAARNAPTLGGAYARMARYGRLLHSGAEVQLHVEEGSARLCYTLPHNPRGSPRHAAEFIVGAWLITGRQMCGLEFAPLAVTFQHPAPPSTAEHRQLFGCEPRFSAAANGLELDAALLARPLVEADTRLGGLLDGFAAELLAKLPRPESFVARVSRLLHQELRGGDPSLEQLARQLQLSPRTLQRRLEAEGTSHQALLDALRRDFALRYLRESALTIGEAAFLLGFSEPSAFHRAFKRWTGQTPSEFQRCAGSSQ